MSKIDLPTIKGGFNLSRINDNFDKIETALNEKVLYRDVPDGEPNQMENDLDMNGQRIYNLPEPQTELEPARKKDIDDIRNAVGSKKNIRVEDVNVPALPDAVFRRNKLLSFDSQGNPQVQFPSADSATQLRIDLANPLIGSDLVSVKDTIAPAYLKTVSDIVNMEPINFLRFVPRNEHVNILDGTSSFNATDRVIEFLNSVNVAEFPRGLIRIPNKILISKSGVKIFGNNTTFIANEGGAAGDAIFDIKGSNIEVSGLTVKSHSGALRGRAFALDANGSDLNNYLFTDIKTGDCFYAIRSTSLDSGVSRVNNLRIRNLYSVAPEGNTNAGHIMVQYTSDVSVSGCHTRGGFNTSAYGFTKDTRNISVVGNSERGLIHSVNYVEGSVQIEECPEANATISGNSFGTDIWISDSSGIVVSSNSCGRLRITVGNTRDTLGANDIVCNDNITAGIRCTSYGVAPAAERINAIFKDNIINPTKQASGLPIADRSITIQGSHAGKITLSGNKVTADATTYGITVSRASGMELELVDNNFGTKPSLISGTGGLIYEKDNINPLRQEGNGYFLVNLVADSPALVNDSWTTVQFSNTVVNINSEYTSGVFTAARSGWYTFEGVLTFGSTLAGSILGSRLVLTKGGTTSELKRVGMTKVPSSGFISMPFGGVRRYLQQGDSVSLQYFVSGSSSTILSGGLGLSQFGAIPF